MSRKMLSGMLTAIQIAMVFVFIAGAVPAQAETLNTYYKVLIAVRKCELTVDEGQLARLQDIIENRVTDTDASSATIDAIFDEIAADIGSDTQAFCTDYSETALAILATL